MTDGKNNNIKIDNFKNNNFTMTVSITKQQRMVKNS